MARPKFAYRHRYDGTYCVRMKDRKTSFKFDKAIYADNPKHAIEVASRLFDKFRFTPFSARLQYKP